MPVILARQSGRVAGQTNKRSHRSNYSEEKFHPVAEWQPARSTRAEACSSAPWREVLLRFVPGRGSTPDDNLPDRCRPWRSEEHTSELQSHSDLVCRLLLEKKKKTKLIVLAILINLAGHGFLLARGLPLMGITAYASLLRNDLQPSTDLAATEIHELTTRQA